MTGKGTISVGVVGVGSLGRHHARVYSELESAEFVGVYDTDATAAQAVAEQYGVTAFDSLEQLADAADAASVVVPTDKHIDTAMLLMAHGTHLLVEKPIASTTAEAETMVSTAQKNDIILQVGHIERFNPVMQFLEDNLTRPSFIEATRLAPYPPPREGAAPRGTEVSVVLDLMIHDLEIILHLVNSPLREIHAVGVPVLSASEDIANARLIFEDGCVANVTASRISQERMRKIRIFQADTYVSLDYMNQEGQLMRRLDGQIGAAPVPIEKGDALTAELSSFLHCVHYQHDPVVSGAHASRALKLATDICRTIRENPS